VVSCAFIFEIIALCVYKNGIHGEKMFIPGLFSHFGPLLSSQQELGSCPEDAG
jgi:hypothetical protein